jgi:type III secretion system FlhB-like substrate exporter
MSKENAPQYTIDTKAQQQMHEEFVKIKDKLHTPKEFYSVMQELTQWLQTLQKQG